MLLVKLWVVANLPLIIFIFFIALQGVLVALCLGPLDGSYVAKKRRSSDPLESTTILDVERSISSLERDGDSGGVISESDRPPSYFGLDDLPPSYEATMEGGADMEGPADWGEMVDNDDAKLD